MYDLQIPTRTELSKLNNKFADKTRDELRAEYMELIKLPTLRTLYNNENEKVAAHQYAVRTWETAESQKFITDFCFWFCDKYVQKFQEIINFMVLHKIKVWSSFFEDERLRGQFIFSIDDYKFLKCGYSINYLTTVERERLNYLIFPFSELRPFGDSSQTKATNEVIAFFVSFFTPKKSEL